LLAACHSHRIQRRITQVYGWADRHTGGFASIIWRAVYNFAQHGPREAAALSYYALFSMFPLLLLLVVLIGWLVGPSSTGSTVNDFLALFLPGATATELSRTVERFVLQGASASIVAFVGLSWSALGLFSNLESALSRTFRDSKGRHFWERRIVGLIMILALGILLIANIMTSLLFSFFDLLFLNRNNIWLSMASIFIPFGFSMGIFAMMYRWIPRTQIGWDAIWPAALLGGVAWELAKRIFGWYLESISNLSLVYGSITTIIIFMLWAFYTSCIILLCAEICIGLSDWQRQRKRRRAIEDQEVEFAGDYYTRMLAEPSRAKRG
jgi:membrane protein